MFCTITPDRGEKERAPLLEFCKHQLSRMTLKPDKSYFITDPPTSPKVDLVERIQRGVEMAKQDGFEYAFIIESDDAYPANYFQQFDIGEFSFYGSTETIYYNLRNRTYSIFTHQGRSSLFVTGFKISALKSFNWYAPKSRFLDVSLWEFSETSVGMRQFIKPSGAIGIKHNLGLCAGKGHTTRGANIDEQLEKLRSWTDDEQFSFYTELMKKL